MSDTLIVVKSLLTVAVSFRACIGIHGIVSLIDIDLNCHTLSPVFHRITYRICPPPPQGAAKSRNGDSYAYHRKSQ